MNHQKERYREATERKSRKSSYLGARQTSKFEGMIFLLLNGSESEHEGICNFRVAEPATREEEESKGWYSKLFDLTYLIILFLHFY